MKPSKDEVLIAAVATWGSEFLADRFLDKPHFALGGKTPRKAIETRRGRLMVMRILVALEMGLPV